MATYSAVLLGGLLAVLAAVSAAAPEAYGAAFAALVFCVPSAMVWLHRGGSDRWAATVGGGLVAGLTVGLFLAVTGMIIVLGHASLPLLGPVLLAAAAWGWVHRADLGGRARARVDGAGAQVRYWVLRPTAPTVDTADPGTVDTADPHPGQPVAEAGISAPQGDPVTMVSRGEERTGTGALCRAWCHSYWLLTELPLERVPWIIGRGRVARS